MIRKGLGNLSQMHVFTVHIVDFGVILGLLRIVTVSSYGAFD